jgi:hypothetical protein
VVWIVRVEHGPRTRLRAAYGTPEFEAEYHAAIRGETISDRRKATHGTLQSLWADYRRSSALASLATATRRQRENIMLGVLKEASDMPLSAVTREAIFAGRERRAKTPSQANNFLNTMRALFSWAVEGGASPKTRSRASRS